MINETALDQFIELGSLPPRTRMAQALGEAGLVLILCVAVLAPALTLNANWPQVRTETMLIVVYAIGYAALQFMGLAKPMRFHAFYIIGALFSLSVGFSLSYGTMILHHPLSYRDYFELPKCWLPVLFFAIAYEVELTESGLNRALNYFAIAVGLVCLFGWAQFLHLGIAARLTPLYTDLGHNYNVLLRYGRIFSTMGNPNSLGQLMSWCMSIYVLAFLFGVGSRARNLCVSAMCVVTVALTSSRYGLLACGGGLLIALGLGMFSRRRGLKLVALLFLVGVLVPVFGEAQQSSYWASHRFEQLRNPLQVDSLRGRLDFLWIEAGDYFLSSPWVGHGPAKTVFESVYTDSEYLDILKYYGLVGFLCYLAYFFWPLLEMSRGLRAMGFLTAELEDRLKANLLVLRAGFAIFCLALFMNAGEFTFYNLQLLAFVWLWAGLAVRASHFVMEAQAQERFATAVEAEPDFAPPPPSTSDQPDLAGFDLRGAQPETP
jgi:O-antigen ligase